MSKAILALIMSVILVSISVPVAINVMSTNETVETINRSYVKQRIPVPESQISESDPIKVYDVKKIITLESKNTVVFRGPVTSDSVSQVMSKLAFMSRRISKKTPIYLVLDTPGGSVFDGTAFIDFCKALPQKVHTVTLFAASMGFQIAQNLDTRYITTNGTLMSHRARGGIRGQFDGEIESRYKMVKRAVDYLDFKAATRMSMKVKDYKKMIKPEYWVHGFDAVNDQAADEQVLVRCGKSLKGTEIVSLRTFFGTIKAKFSKCPLIKAPVSIKLQGEEARIPYLNYLSKISFSDKQKFIRDMLEEDKLGKNFPIR